MCRCVAAVYYRVIQSSFVSQRVSLGFDNSKIALFSAADFFNAFHSLAANANGSGPGITLDVAKQGAEKVKRLSSIHAFIVLRDRRWFLVTAGRRWLRADRHISLRPYASPHTQLPTVRMKKKNEHNNPEMRKGISKRRFRIAFPSVSCVCVSVCATMRCNRVSFIAGDPASAPHFSSVHLAD